MLRLSLLISLLLATVALPAQTLYVDLSVGSNLNPGTDPSAPLRTLRRALNRAAADPAITRIEVAAATYRPGSARTDAFDLVSGVDVIGGYEPGSGFAIRDPEAHVTVLSGAIGAAGPEDNSHCVVRAQNVSNVRLEGFHIRRGYGGATGLGGAGLFASYSTLQVNDCRFFANRAPSGGAAYIAFGVGITFSRCTFINNHATVDGGAIEVSAGTSNNGGSNVLVLRCRFLGNTADSHGGAVDNTVGTLQIWNSAFSGNVCGYKGGAVAVTGYPSTTRLGNCSLCLNHADYYAGGAYCSVGDLHITNSILWGDSAAIADDEILVSSSGSLVLESSCVAGAAAFGGVANFDEDPNFLDADGLDNLAGTLDDDLRIPHPALADSPCAEVGDNSLIAGAHLQLDLAGETRIRGLDVIIIAGSATVELGAYEIAPLVVAYHGTDEDLWVRVEVNGIPLGLEIVFFPPGFVDTDIVPLESGDRVTARVSSAEGTFVGLDAQLWIQPFEGGLPPGGPIGFPKLYVDVYEEALPLGAVPASIFSDIVVPAGLAGLQFMMQAVVIHASAANGVFAATNGRELRFL